MNEIEHFLIGVNPGIRKLLKHLKDIFEKQTCSSYVKTIYMGFDIDKEMVAAVYPHSNYIDIALALEEDHPDSALKDASHLTWRTLPVSLEVSTLNEIDQNIGLLHEACKRVQDGMANKPRDNEFFRKARRERREKKS